MIYRKAIFFFPEVLLSLYLTEMHVSLCAAKSQIQVTW